MVLEMASSKWFMSPEELRKRIHYRTVSRVQFDETLGTTVAKYREGTRICVERARLITEAYKESEGEPEILKKAKAIKKIVEGMTIYIKLGELIVGNISSTPESLPTYPEISHRWLSRSIMREYRDMLSEKEKAELLEIHKYWAGKSIDDRVREILPDDLKQYLGFHSYALATTHNLSLAWVVPNYEELFKVGLGGLLNECEKRLAELEKSWKPEEAREYIKKKNFYRAVKIALEAAISWIKRYADLAKELAKKEEMSITWKKQLERIASVCEWISTNPPRTFHEALQLYHFVYLLLYAVETRGQGDGIRFDIVMYPFYKKDIEEGRLTRDEAKELLKFLWVKKDELGHLNLPTLVGQSAGENLYQTLNLGGIDAEGNPVCNEVSHLMLEATMDMRTIQPTFAFRYNSRTPQELIDKAIDCVKTGVGFPAFFNDDVMIPYLLRRGIPLEDARNYTVPVCIIWSIPGKSIRPHVIHGGVFVAIKCLDLALNQGIDKFSGKRVGYPTPDPTTFKSIEDVMDAFLKQVEYIAEKAVRIRNVLDAVYEEYGPRPLASAFLDGCMEKGKEAAKNIYHDWVFFLVAGIVNVINSLAVIKKLVFEDKVVSMEELLKALRNNWEGYEWLRQKAINDVPKFGNDDPYVDELMRWVHEETNKIFRQHKGIYGGAYTLESSIAAGYYAAALKTWATPDGRKAGEPVADATVSPMAGRDKKGPTAVLKSVSNLNPLRTGWNHLLNQRFLPQYVTGEYKEVFANYLKTWSKLPIWHIQFNVVSNEVLRDAQKNPEKYQNLVVRVAGYSARFIDLPKEVQEDIIRRVEQTFA